jgi:alpha-L-fucosidase
MSNTLIPRLAVLCTAVFISNTNVGAAEEHREQRDARMQWWREAKFGMFIHWGLYAIPARGEWVMNRERIPVAEYAKLAAQFNPVKFNAAQWVRVAKDAGMKYIVITSKHHDGFAMFESKVSPYNIVDATPFKRDPMKELAEACAKEGIGLGFYYSQAQDWHQPGGAVARGSWDPAQKGEFAQYLHTVSIPQIKELLSGYHPAVIWFDTPVNMTPAYGREIMQLVRSLRPEAIVNSRLLYSGAKVEQLGQAQLDELRDIGVDYLSYRDRTIPEQPKWRDWETCMTLNGAWGYTAADHNWKSPKTVVQMLAEVVSKGGNFLLNFGPTAEGELPAESVAVVKQVGAWLRVNGEAIYGAGPKSDLKGTRAPAAASSLEIGKKKRSNAKAVKSGPAIQPESEIDWLATSRPAAKEAGQPAKIYLHIFKWPDGRLEVKGMTSKVSKAYLLGDAKHTPLKFSQSAETFSVELPPIAPDPIATVVCLECATK